MPPRADFECKKCQATYDDLPLTSTRCPVCGFKRGFRRLFNRVNVGNGQAHAAAGIVDRVVVPEYDKQQQIRSEAIQAALPSRAYNPQMAAAWLSAAQASHSNPGGGNALHAMPILNGLRGLVPRPFGRAE